MKKFITVSTLLLITLFIKAQTFYFNHTGADQTFVVPAGVTTISVKLWGAGGGGGDNNNTGPGGGGAYVSGVLCVTPGETLTIVTGGRGRQGGPNASVITYGGGGIGRDYSRDGGSGGGRSAIIRGGVQVAIAGGGGGGGGSGTNGGDGFRYHGGAAGGVGSDGIRGGDRDNFSGGAGGCGGLNSGAIQNCNGGGNATGSQGGNGESGSFTYGGGGGGGGYAGGEGGASGGNNSGGGGGGSSFFSGTNLVTTSGNARIAGNANDPDNGNAYGGGGDRGADNAQNGRVVITIVPGLPAITGNPSACVNATTQLSNAVPGGTWSSNNTGVASISNAGLVTGISAGTATITYSLTTACGVSSTSQLVTVNAAPVIPAITGGNAVCTGNTLQLNNSTAGGSWTSSDVTVATVDNNGLVSGISNGSANIFYSLSNVCGSSTSTQPVSVNSAPVLSSIAGGTEVCTASTLQLTNAFSGGLWSSSDNTVATVDNNGLVTGIAAGQASITYAATNSCGSATENLLMNVGTAPSLPAITGGTDVCAGSSLQLSNSTPGGIWSSADNNVAIVDTAGLILAVNAGTVNISYTLANNCGSNSVTQAVSVGSIPVVPAITGGSSACSGNTLQLANSATGGTWYSSDTTLATVDNTGLVTSMEQGVVAISYALTNTCGTASVSQNISVNSTPVIDSVVAVNVSCGAAATGSITIYAGPGSLNYSIDNGQTFQTGNTFTALNNGTYAIVVEGNGCQATSSAIVSSTAGISATASSTNTTCGTANGTATVNVTGGSAVTYLWSNNTTAQTATSLSAGNYTVTVTDANGCTATAATTVGTSSVTLPSITSATTQICSGDSTQICATAGYTNYLWSSGATGTCINATLPGDYNVTATDANGCTAVSQNLTITTFTPPSVSVSVNGNMLSAFNASSYQWYYNGNPIPGATSSTYTATASGSYYVVVTDANGCTATSNPVQVIVSGLLHVDETGIMVYPNPAQNTGWNIRVPENWLGAQLLLTNAEGKIVVAQLIEAADVTVDAGLPAGVYTLQLKRVDFSTAVKLIKL